MMGKREGEREKASEQRGRRQRENLSKRGTGLSGYRYNKIPQMLHFGGGSGNFFSIHDENGN